jgi:hypothetical protein
MKKIEREGRLGEHEIVTVIGKGGSVHLSYSVVMLVGHTPSRISSSIGGEVTSVKWENDILLHAEK